MGFRPRERRLALSAAILIGCWVLLSWVVLPLWDQIREARLQVEMQTARLEAVGRLLVQAPVVERAYQGLTPYLETEDDERAHSALLSELEALSRSANLEINLKPRPAKPMDRIRAVEIELDVEGAQMDLMVFLDSLLRMPRLVAIERLRISSVHSRQDVLRANLVLQHLILRR